MNEFERLLKAQPFRELPPEWRAGVFEADFLPAVSESPASWRDWLWPSPAAWGALAAVWLLILALQNILFPDSGGAPSTPSFVTNPPTSSGQTPQTFHYTSTDNPLLASLR